MDVSKARCSGCGQPLEIKRLDERVALVDKLRKIKSPQGRWAKINVSVAASGCRHGSRSQRGRNLHGDGKRGQYGPTVVPQSCRSRWFSAAPTRVVRA